MKNYNNKKSSAYDDIIDHDRHISSTRPHMKLKDRAAQFAPFAAVVGHEAATREAARYTEEKRELDETQIALLDEKLREIDLSLPSDSKYKFVYFVPDTRKSGGSYIEKTDRVLKIDSYKRKVHMMDGSIIEIDAIYNILDN